MSHNYAKGIKFYFHSKEKFDKLLDQVKIIDEDEYNEEAKDGFQMLYTYWNNKSSRRFNGKLKSNENRIKYL